MDDITHVRLIDPHPESDCSTNNTCFVANKVFLISGPFIGFQAGVVGNGRQTCVNQHIGHAFSRFTRLAVDDAGFLWPGGCKFPHLFRRFLFGDHTIAQVWPVEAGKEQGRVLKF